MMRRIFWLMMMAMSVTMVAQTQQGVVKTRGRMVNGKHVPGQGLSGATIQVQGRSAVVSQGGGTFSFPIPSPTFLVQSVTKQGYQLVDADAMKKPFKHSANPLYLVMEMPEQQRADQLAKERRLRRDLQRRLQQKEDEVENLNISLDEKNRLLQEINKERDDNEKIIKDLSRYYATLDYDQLEEFQRTVNNLLEDGQLEKADSLLRSRGNMASRVLSNLMEQKAEAEEAEELALRQSRLTTSKEITMKRRDDIAADCYSFFQRFLQIHQNDSAAWYLELRASLDTTNVVWLDDLAWFSNTYMANYAKALDYYEKALRCASAMVEKDSDDIARLHYKIGGVCMSLNQYDKALEYVQKALNIFISLYDEDDTDVADCYDRIGLIYDRKGNWGRSIENLEKAFNIRLEICDNDDMDIASSINNIAVVCSNYGEVDSAYMDLLTSAIGIALDNFDEDDVRLASFYNNIATAFSDFGKQDSALYYCQKALSLYKKEFGELHPDVALMYFNMGSFYVRQEQYNESFAFYRKALGIYQSVFGERHEKVADCYSELGTSYFLQDSLDVAMEYFQKALEIRRSLFGEQHDDVATSYRCIGHVHFRRQDYLLALDCYSKALKIREEVLGRGHIETAKVCHDIADTYKDFGLLGTAVSYYQRTIGIYKQNGKKEKLIELYGELGDVYYENVDYDAALECYQDELRIQLGTIGEQTDDVARTYRWMGHASYRAEYFEQALAYYQRSFDIRKNVLTPGNVNTAIVCKDLADTYRKLKNHVKSVEYYQEATRLYQLVGQTDEDDLENIKEISERFISESIWAGIECIARKDYVLAVKYYSQVLDSIMVKGDKTDMVSCSIGLGNAYSGTGDYRTAVHYYEMARRYLRLVDDYKNKEVIDNDLNSCILVCRYELALLCSKTDDDFLDEIIFLAYFTEGDTPAQRQGLNGEYVLLSLTGWEVDSKHSFYANNENQMHHPIDLIVMKEDIISEHHFDDKVGVKFYIRQVGKSERSRIISIYEDWKRQRKE